MKKHILPFLLTPLISLFSSSSTALVCSDDAAQNIVSSNNYIFQILDYIDTPTMGIQKETRTTATMLDNNNDPISTSKHALEYDPSGLIVKSDYELFSKQHELLYSERLSKTKAGWENTIVDFEDKRSSIINYMMDKQNRIVGSQQVKKSADFLYLETDTYQYDSHNCVVNKNSTWQLKGLNEKGEFVGEDESGSSKYSYQYQDNLLAKVVYDFGNKMKSENIFDYKYGENNRLISIQSTYTSNNDSTSYITQFLTFNDKGAWLSARKVRQAKTNQSVAINREITYY